MPLRDEIDRGQTGGLTGWSSLAPETGGNIWGEGCRVCDFFSFSFLAGGEATELCSRSLVFSLKLPFSTWVAAPVL